MIQEKQRCRLRRAARFPGLVLALALVLPLALFCLAGCEDVHGQTGGSADSQRAGGHVQLGFPF
jgi:hypothetical protein